MSEYISTSGVEEEDRKLLFAQFINNLKLASTTEARPRPSLPQNSADNSKMEIQEDEGSVASSSGYSLDDPEDTKPPAAAVEVQLPVGDDGNKLADNRKMAVEDQSSVASSSWSMISSSGPPAAAASAAAADANANDDSSMAGSSTVSGFDLISLGGSSQKPCPQCTFLNHTAALLCEMCSTMLKTDTVTGVDLLALQLQEQEDQEEAWEGIPTPLLRKAQKLTQEIQSVVEDVYLKSTWGVKSAWGKPIHPFPLTVPPSMDLTRMVAMFLAKQKHPQPIKLCYCFTIDTEIVQREINEKGFARGTLFGTIPEAAVRAYHGSKPRDSLQNFLKRKRDRAKANHLQRFLREGPMDYVPPEHCVGWLVAIVGSPGQAPGDHQVHVQSGMAWVCKRTPSTSLPLVSFPADKMETDVVRQLLNGMILTFNDSPTFWNNTLSSDAGRGGCGVRPSEMEVDTAPRPASASAE